MTQAMLPEREGHTEEGDRRRWLALAVIVAAQFMVVLDVAIVNVALPSIKTDLHFSESNLQWVITAYSILFGGVLLLGGGLAGRAVDPDDDLRRGTRAQPRPRHLGRRLGQRSRSGRAARRRADERVQL